MARGRKKGEAFDFEGSLKKLEDIVKKLEEERLPLEESLRLFAEGKKLARSCEKELTRAENQVRMLMEDDRGEITESEFEGEESPEPGEADGGGEAEVPAAVNEAGTAERRGAAGEDGPPF